ncbi:PIG-L deacetylase family protein, partial [Bacteroides salyersiae]
MHCTVSPISEPGSIEPKESLLIIAPHPDDEVIGCAGLIQRSLNKGNNVYVIILTGGEASHNGC